MQPVLIGIAVYLVLQFAIGLAVSRRSRARATTCSRGAASASGSRRSRSSRPGSAPRRSSARRAPSTPTGWAAVRPIRSATGCASSCSGLVIAAPLWRRSYTTFGDLFRERYSPGVERLAVLLMVPTSVLWAAAQIRAFGQVVSASSDVEVHVAITAAAVFVIIYTVAGGLLADVVTDFVQGIAVIVGLVVLLIAIGNAHGGFGELFAMIEPERLALFSTRRHSAARDPRSVGRAGLRLAARSGDVVADPRLPARPRRRATRRSSARRSTCRSADSRRASASRARSSCPNLEEPEQLVTLLAQQHLSTFFYVLFAGALISAILSTVDSCLLARRVARLAQHGPAAAPESERARQDLVRAHRRDRVRRARVRDRAVRGRHLRARRHGLGLRQRGHLRRRPLRPVQQRRRRAQRLRRL